MTNPDQNEPKISFAEQHDPSDARLYAPAAARNSEPIVAALKPHLPESGNALEIASGTGEHVIKLAVASPGVAWHPTDVDLKRLASIDAWASHAQRSNIAPAQFYDVTSKGWSGPPMGFVFLSNLLHLLVKDAALSALTNMAGALKPAGRLAIYGPFKRDGSFVTEGDVRFDAKIRSDMPGAGYKDTVWVRQVLDELGMRPSASIEMPANNLMEVWIR